MTGFNNTMFSKQNILQIIESQKKRDGKLQQAQYITLSKALKNQTDFVRGFLTVIISFLTSASFIKN